MKGLSLKIFLFISFFLLIVSLTINFLFWNKLKEIKPILYYEVPPQNTFFYDKNENNIYLNDSLIYTIEKEKERLIKNNENFVFVDLDKMELYLYKDGEILKTFPVLAKGADWFWGKTPSGIYKSDIKSSLHFSSIAKVWMPYSVRFYGNFFIHGWPYTSSGKLISNPVSGGCIRLKTSDAAELFNFVEKNTPILILDREEKKNIKPLTGFGTNNLINNEEISNLKSENIFLADLDTGEVIIDKNGESIINADSILILALALTFTESVNLEKSITAKNWMWDGINENVLVSGRSYKGLDLLKIALSKNSLSAISVLSRFGDPEKVLELLNYKVKSIGMENTSFHNYLSFSSQNITNFYDVAKLITYIKNYHPFIIDFLETDKSLYEFSSAFKVLKIKNLNDGQDTERYLFLGVAGSFNANEDLNGILSLINDKLKLTINN
jgi:lipoprotein-anchoring transpeptidase ErfK/SrfK